MQITKVRAKGARVHIEWTTQCEGSGEPDEHVLRSNERPLQSFIDALLGLRQAIVEEAELPEEWVEEITPIGLSLTHYTDGRMGAVISGKRKLQNSNSPLVINTPHKPDEAPNESAPTPTLSPVAVAAIDEVLQEAVKYIQGERAQQSLPFDEEPSKGERSTAKGIEIKIDGNKECSECGKPGATESGLCLGCIAKKVSVGAAAE